MKFTQPSVRFIPDHICQLPQKTEAATRYISDGFFVKTRRKIWKWVTVDSSNSQSKLYLKSASRIDEEKLRHIDGYPNTIHPFSQFKSVWEGIMTIVFLAFFLIVPIINNTNSVHLYLRYAIQFPCKLDIILCFLTGYFDVEKQVVVLNGRKIVWHYLKTFFIFDFVSSFAFSAFFVTINSTQPQIIGFTNVLKLVRIPTLKRYITRRLENWNVNSSVINFICSTLWICIIILWASFLLYIITQKCCMDHFRIYKKVGWVYLMTVYRVIRGLFLVGITIFSDTHTFEYIMTLVCIICGAFLDIYILATKLRFFQKRSSLVNKFNYLQEEITEYMNYKELPTVLRKKIERYISFKFQKHIFREEDLLMNLSPSLKRDILLHTCRTMVANVDFLKDLPNHIILKIVTKLKNEIYLPNDVIVYSGDAGNCMYFILMGDVAIYAPNEKEICHLNDGDHFGEIALVINAPRVATVVAVRECELYKLSRKDFQEVIGPFPDLLKKIKASALERLKSTMELVDEDRANMKSLRNVSNLSL